MNTLRTLIFSLLISLSAAAQSVPFQIQIEPVNAQAVPPVHSFAFAKQGSKWLIVGGRTNGLHGFSTNDNFDVMYANEFIVVVDTATWTYDAATIVGLPMNIKDPLRSTNMQYTVIGNYLYMAGGFGWDSTANRYDTYATLTAIRIDSMINAVENGLPIAPHIRQITDTALQVCGGEMITIGDTTYLAFGHYFRGRYQETPGPVFVQVYTERLKKFVINDDGVNLSLTHISQVSDTTHFHRRDLNVAPAIDPNGNECWTAFSGVFRKDVDLPYLNPVSFAANGAYTVDTSFDQRLNNYTCAMLPLFDSVHGTMYTVMFGGCSQDDYNPSNGNMTYDSLVPFVADISVMVRSAGGQWAQVPLQVQLPGLLGSNMKFVPVDTVPMYGNEVVRLRDVQGRILVGYLYGGIEASAPNDQPSIADDAILRVYLTPDQVVLNTIDHTSDIAEVFPNPVSDVLFVTIEEPGTVIELRNFAGQIVYTAKYNSAGSVTVPVDKYAAGNYTLTVKAPEQTRAYPITITH